MKLSTSFFLSSLVLYGSQQQLTATALNCSVTGKAASDGVHFSTCDHFQGIDVDAYLNWYETSDVSTKYPNQVYIAGSDPEAPENGAAIHWKVDEEYAYLAIAARATGWLAFGISEAGGMIGTDMVMFTAARPDELVDAYTGDDRYPQVDDCEGNWEMVSSHVDAEGGFIMFETKRLLDTNDPQDKPIVDDSSSMISPHRIIAAWGDSEEVGYHGLNRARGSIRFFGSGDEESTFTDAMDEMAEGTFEIRAREYLVPEMETYYAYICFSRDDLIEQGVLNTTDSLNIIGWEPFIQAGNDPYVHHFVVHASSDPFCPENVTSEETFANFPEISYVWAPGEGGLALPEFLGSPLFGEDGFQSFTIEIHYNNPSLIPDVVDNSGVRMYWTSEAREQQVGIMTLGDPNIGVFGQLVGAGLTRHEFDCPSTCSSFVNQEVTVVREYLHMHQIGMRMTNEQIRGDDVIRAGRVEHWEFEQNGNAAVQQGSFVISPGDSFKTTCYYEDKDGTRTFGLASAQEMCMAFLYYYPRAKIDLGGFSFPWTCGHNLGFEACDAAHVATSLADKLELNREFASFNDNCPVEPDTDPIEPDTDNVDDADGNEGSGTAGYRYAFSMSIAGAIVIVGAMV